MTEEEAKTKLCEGDRGMEHHAAARYVVRNMAKFGLPLEPFEGYCGLAGKP